MFEQPAQAYFCNTVNNAFDVMNSSKVYHGFNRNKCALGINEVEQRAALAEMEKLLSSMKFGNANENRQRKEQMQFAKGLICAIKGVIFLFEQMKKEGFKYLMTTKVYCVVYLSRLCLKQILYTQVNQDCCENLFSVVRSMGSGPHPNPLEFATRMRVIKVKNNIDALVPDGANVKLAKDGSDDPCLESELGIIS